jgi:hypothetical protein
MLNLAQRTLFEHEIARRQEPRLDSKPGLAMLTNPYFNDLLAPVCERVKVMLQDWETAVGNLSPDLRALAQEPHWVF